MRREPAAPLCRAQLVPARSGPNQPPPPSRACCAESQTGRLMMGCMPSLITVCPAVALSGAPFATHHNFQIKTYV